MKLKSFILLLANLVLIDSFCYSQYQKVQNEDCDIHYRIFGEGDPILILGGGPGDNSNRYLSLCELLSKDFQCILVDQRGTGKSIPTVYDSTTISISLTLRDFEVLRQELGLYEWSVLGFSYGGYLASIYADYYQLTVSHLILLESIGLNTDVLDYFTDNIDSRLNDEDRHTFEFWSDSTRISKDPHHALVERIRARMPGYFFDRKKSMQISQFMVDSDFNFEAGPFIWEDIEKNGMDLSKTECSFNKPVLILHGRQDPVGESVPVYLSDYYPNSHLVFIEKAGHYSWIEQPGEVKKAIINFLKDR